MTTEQNRVDGAENMLKFLAEFDKCAESVGAGRRQMNLRAVKALVRSNKDGASNLAKVYCLYAATEPKAIQVSYLVALIYKMEFNDAAVLDFVKEKLAELGLQEQVDRLAYMDHSIAP